MTNNEEDETGMANRNAEFESHVENAITELESAKQELEGNDGKTNRLREDLEETTEQLFNEVLQVVRDEFE